MINIPGINHGAIYKVSFEKYNPLLAYGEDLDIKDGVLLIKNAVSACLIVPRRVFYSRSTWEHMEIEELDSLSGQVVLTVQ
jgi:hypothetical protein